MKLFILLINILRILTLCSNIKIQGSIFPSPKEQKFFQFYLTDLRKEKIESFEDIPIIPITSISVIALDTNQLYEKQSELVELGEGLSELCSNIKWESGESPFFASPEVKSKLSNQYKLAKLFTSGSHLELVKSKWQNFVKDFRFGTIDLDKLKEQLEIYIPHSSIKTYDIEFSDSKYSFRLSGKIVQSSTGSQEKTFTGRLNLIFLIPYSQGFLEETKKGLLAALKKDEDTTFEAKINDQTFNKYPYFEVNFGRAIVIKRTVDSSQIPSYEIIFEQVGEDRPTLSLWIMNHLIFEIKKKHKNYPHVNFRRVGLGDKINIEKVNSLLDEYFKISWPKTANPEQDTTKPKNGKRTPIIILALIFCIAFAIFLVGCYYRKKVNIFLGRFYKKRQRRKKLKNQK